MENLLRIDSSARHDGSRSRQLADRIEAAWRRSRPGAAVVRRDLAAEPVPHISDHTIAGFFAPQEQQNEVTRAATELSDRLIRELLAADAILFGVPIYNFSIPSVLKAYFDQVVRIGRTFGYDPAKGLFGLVENRPVYVAAIYGASGYGAGDLEPFNHLEPYLRSLLGFLGLREITFFSVEGTSLDPARAEIDETRAGAAIDSMFAAVP
jgi:FMN-dependent NADH-azoreductase